MAHAQVARKTKKTTGPRALGLVDLSASGQARLIPVCIMMDGKFYDAGAYKASPVPFALWTGTVYEGEKTGVPQGLFTVAEAGHFGNDIWFGQGKWAPAGSESKARPKKENDSKPKMEVDEGPPKLRRPGSERSPDSSEPAPTPPPSSGPPQSGTTAPSGPEKPSSASQDKSPDATSDQKKTDASASTSSNDEDPNRPVLKRGKTETLGQERPQVGASTGVPRRPAGAAATSEAKKVSSQLIPAISDAGGPDPRPYTYDMKPSEEEKYKKGMLALASDAFTAKLRELTPAATPAEPATRKAVHHPAAKGPQPIFENVQFRAFDLWNTNEPVFVLSATARVAKSGASSDDTPDQNYDVTLVAKNNIYDELRKLYVGITDAHHLDQTPRMELIDAVDADGDGRGELLFRTTSDVGKAWAVYRAGADQLFPLFEGTPPENKPPSQ